MHVLVPCVDTDLALWILLYTLSAAGVPAPDFHVTGLRPCLSLHLQCFPGAGGCAQCHRETSFLLHEAQQNVLTPVMWCARIGKVGVGFRHGGLFRSQDRHADFHGE